MGKRQLRRALSLRPEIFATAQAAARFVGMSTTAFVEDAVRRRLEQIGIPVLDRDVALARLGVEPVSGFTSSTSTGDAS